MNEKNELSCGAVAAIFGIAVLVGVFLWQMPEVKDKSGEWAAWVQAAGSIGAILAALKVVDRQRKNDRAARSEQRAEQLRALTTLFRTCQSRMTQIYGRLNSNSESLESKLSYAPKWRNLLSTPVNAVKGVPFHEIPFAFLCGPSMAGIYDLERCLDLLDRISKIEPSDVLAYVQFDLLMQELTQKRLDFYLEYRAVRRSVLSHST